MNYINHMIKGVPYGKEKSRGDTEAAERWSQQIREQSKNLPRVKDACVLKVTFLLPPDKFPTDYPYGPDLDNLLKRFLDTLNETVFSEAMGLDSCVVSMTVMKTKIASTDEPGVHFEVMPVAVR